jgi:acetyl-CoA acyltransferase
VDDVVIIDAVRSPMGKGKPGGALSELHAVELLGQVIKALMDRVDIDPSEVDDVIAGCVSQMADQAGNPARWAWLAAGLPETVPGTTVDRRCGSSQQAVHFAVQGVMAGAYDIVVAAGVESMSRIPMGSARQNQDPFGPSAQKRYAPGLVPQGISAELLAVANGLTRDDLDAYSERSHRLAAATAEAGDFRSEIVPVTVPGDDGKFRTVVADETIRPQTTVESLGALRAVFESAEYDARFPQINWMITAGNSSQLSDGAAAMLIMSARRAAALGLRPRARFHALSLAAEDPLIMLTAPVPATAKALKKGGLAIDEIDHFEINEAFASVPLAWQRETGADPERVNPRGGAIALGHPLGASGVRLMTTMLHALDQTGGRWGLQSMCEGGGMANATIIERL